MFSMAKRHLSSWKKCLLITKQIWKKVVNQQPPVPRLHHQRNRKSTPPAEAFEKISSIDPEVAAALKDYREHQEIVLAALVNGMLKGNAHQFVKIKVQTAREAVDRSCQNAPELYKAYDAYPKVAYFLARLGESLMGRTLRLHDTTEQFDVIWNAEVSTVKDLRRFVSQCQANIRAYMQNHNARFPLPSDEVLVNQYLRKMGLSDDPTVRDLAIELTDAIKKLEESDEGITLVLNLFVFLNCKFVSRHYKQKLMNSEINH